MNRHIALATFAAFGLASVLSAETQRPPAQTPPAQTPQPAQAPARSDVDAKVTVMGCLERDTTVAAASVDPPRGGGDTTSRQAAQQVQATPQTTYKLTRFETKVDLTGATVRRGTGSGSAGTGTAQGRSAQEMQKSSELAVQAAAGSTVDFVTHVNHKVELTGTLEKWDMAATMTGSSATGTTGSSTSRAAGAAPDNRRDKPTLSVTALKVIAASCTGH